MLNNPQMGLLPNDLEQRMLEYFKMLQQPKEAARKLSSSEDDLKASEIFPNDVYVFSWF